MLIGIFQRIVLVPCKIVRSIGWTTGISGCLTPNPLRRTRLPLGRANCRSRLLLRLRHRSSSKGLPQAQIYL